MPHSLHFGRLAESYITRATNLPLKTAHTLMFWWKYTSDSVSYPYVFSYATADTTSEYALANDGSHWLISNASAGVDLSPQPTTGRWHHIAITVSGTSGNNFLCYMDGVLAATNASISITPTYLAFGSEGGGAAGQWANQQIAAIKIWDRVLTLAEIVAEMPFALPYNPGGLNSCYPMPTGWERVAWGIGAKTGSVSPYVDWSGNGDRIWTVSGTVDHDLGPPIG